MSGMLSVRFPADLIAAVRRFARQDGVTVSKWLRDLIAAELKNPQRQPPVDFCQYPQTKTVASGSAVTIKYDIWPASASSVTGYHA